MTKRSERSDNNRLATDRVRLPAARAPLPPPSSLVIRMTVQTEKQDYLECRPIFSDGSQPDSGYLRVAKPVHLRGAIATREGDSGTETIDPDYATQAEILAVRVDNGTGVDDEDGRALTWIEITHRDWIIDC